MTLPEVAELMSISERTARRWVRDGRLRAVKIGKTVRVTPSDLVSLLDAHRTLPFPGIDFDGLRDKPGT